MNRPGELAGGTPALPGDGDLNGGLRFPLQRHQILRNSELGQAGNAVDIKLAHDSLAVGFDGAHADPEATGDFLVAQPLGNGDQDLAFPGTDLARMRAIAGPADKLI